MTGETLSHKQVKPGDWTEPIESTWSKIRELIQYSQTQNINSIRTEFGDLSNAERETLFMFLVRAAQEIAVAWKLHALTMMD